MRFATHNNYNPAGGGVLPPSKVGAKCKNKPNKANKSIFTAFCPLNNKSINRKAKRHQNANKYLLDMKVKVNQQITEQRLRNFKFSGKAKENANLLLPNELDEIEREFMNYYNTTQIIWDDIAINNLFDKYFENVLCYLNYCSLEEFRHNRVTLHNYDRINVARLDRGEDDLIHDAYINLDL